MLILSRKVGERIIIGNGIEVVVQRVSGDRVTLGLAAPKDVKILRGELEEYQPVTTAGELERQPEYSRPLLTRRQRAR